MFRERAIARVHQRHAFGGQVVIVVLAAAIEAGHVLELDHGGLHVLVLHQRQYAPVAGAERLQAAVEGQGVALGFDVIVANDIASGRLVRLFDVGYPERILYSLVTPGSWAERPRIAAFRSWLMRQTGALAAANHLQALCAAEDISVHARP